jgi:hypothetical protein
MSAKKLKENFPNKETYLKYLEKGKWRAGPFFSRSNFERLKRENNYGGVVKRDPSAAARRNNWVHKNEFFNDPNTNRLVNQLVKKYGFENRPALYRAYLHNINFYHTKKTGMSELNKQRVKNRLRNINEKGRLVYFAKHGNLWERVYYHRKANVVRVPQIRLNQHPFLKPLLIPKNSPLIRGLPNGNYVKASNAQKIFDTQMKNIQKTVRAVRGLEAAKPILLTLYERARRRRLAREWAEGLRNMFKNVRINPNGTINLSNLKKSFIKAVSMKRKAPNTNNVPNNANKAELNRIAAERRRLINEARGQPGSPRNAKTWQRTNTGNVIRKNKN